MIDSKEEWRALRAQLPNAICVACVFTAYSISSQDGVGILIVAAYFAGLFAPALRGDKK